MHAEIGFSMQGDSPRAELVSWSLPCGWTPAKCNPASGGDPLQRTLLLVLRSEKTLETQHSALCSRS